MAIEVRDVPAEHRYVATVDGRPAGWSAYGRRPGVVVFRHTEVDDAFEGQGVGSALVRGALEDARAQRLAVLPVCPFVRGYLERHPEHANLVPADQRERFGLPA